MPADLLRRTIALPTLAVGDTVRGALTPPRGGAGVPTGALQAAIDWLQMPNGDLTEPWLFLIGADGRVVDRWGSMWSEAEVEAEVEALPPMKAKR